MAMDSMIHRDANLTCPYFHLIVALLEVVVFQ
jgi:hypothetical protein